MTVASGPDFYRDQRSAAEAAHAGRDDVTIVIRGRRAEDMIARGETDARLIHDLVQKLDGLEASAAERAAEQERLGQLVQELRGHVGQLGGHVAEQVTQLRTEVGRLRDELGDQGYKFRHLQVKIDELAATVSGLAVQSAPGSSGSENGTGASHDSPPSVSTATSAGAPGGTRSNGWFRGLNLGLWSVLGPAVGLLMAAAAGGAALLIYG